MISSLIVRNKLETKKEFEEFEEMKCLESVCISKKFSLPFIFKEIRSYLSFLYPLE